MTIYIPQNIDPFNTHLKNLIQEYFAKKIEVIVGFDNFFSLTIVPDIIHFHFLEGILKYLKYDESLFFEKLESFKNKGVKFLYTFHDIQPHAKITQINYSVFFKSFLGYINLFIHHGELSIGIIKEKFPYISAKKHIICPHGDYLNDMSNFHESQSSAREILKLPKKQKIILIFGQLQFKNTAFALQVFNQVKEKYVESVLLMAGVNPIFKYNRINLLYYKFNNKLFNKFRSNKIFIHKRFSHFETYLLFIASDLVFLPHKSGLTSGLIPLAATIGKPFVYPNIGIFEEQAKYCLAEEYGCENKIEAYKAIDKILTSNIQTFDNTKWLEKNNWNIHVENILNNL
jgi:beta-1,4-mannosyltransferase